MSTNQLFEPLTAEQRSEREKWFRDLRNALGMPFEPHLVHWRIGRKSGNRAAVLAYIDVRDTRRRLNQVVGAGNWHESISDGAATCIVHAGITDPFTGTIVWKADGAGDTNVEKDKGRISDAKKRAWVNWGVGEYLYYLESPWVETNGNEIAQESLELLRGYLGDFTEALMEGVPFEEIQIKVQSPRSTPPPARKSREVEPAQEEPENAPRKTSTNNPISEPQAKKILAECREAGESFSIHGFEVAQAVLKEMEIPCPARKGTKYPDWIEWLCAEVSKGQMDSILELAKAWEPSKETEAF